MKSQEQHYFDLGKDIQKHEFNRDSFFKGFIIGAMCVLIAFLLNLLKQ